MDEHHEQKTIAKLKSGNINALVPLVTAYQHRALRAAYLVTQDHAIAQDITQSAFLRAFDNIDQFDATKRFLPWFLRIVVNLAVQAVKSQARTISLETPTNDEAISLADMLPDRLRNPESQIEVKELEDHIEALLKQLSPDQRAVIVLRYYVDYTEAQMATLLNVPQGTIKSRLFTARQQLRRLLGSSS